MAAQIRSISGNRPAPAESSDRLLYRLEDAAAQLSIGRTKLYGLLRNDELPSVVLGGHRLIAHEDLVAFVERLRTSAQPYADTAT